MALNILQDLKRAAQVHNIIQDLRAILQALRTIIQALRAILRALRAILRALRAILRALRAILRALRVILQVHRVMSLLALRTTNIPVDLMEQHLEPLTVRDLTINVVQDEDLLANLKEKVAGVVEHIPLNPALNLKEKVVGVVEHIPLNPAPAHKLPSHPVPLQLVKLQEVKVKATKTTEAKEKPLEKVAGVDHMEATPKLESAFEIVGLRER